MSTNFANVAEEARQLDTGSKEELVRLLRAWLVEERREEIRQNAVNAERELSLGKAKSGTVEDLMADLYAQD
jgi:hypothetical protein